MSNPKVFERTEEEKTRCIQMHNASRSELLKRQLSNNENYDKAILALSSASLAFSLTVIRFIVPLDGATNLWAIRTSWALFLITILCSLGAYLVSNSAISRQLDIEEDYYINGLVKAQTEKNRWASINDTLNYVTGIVFVSAISFVIYFLIINVNRESVMSKKSTSNTMTALNSASVPKMQIAPGTVDKSTAKTPSMPLAPGKASGKQTAEPGGSSNPPDGGTTKK